MTGTGVKEAAALCISAKCWHQAAALSCIGNYVLPAAATTLYQEQELSSMTELFSVAGPVIWNSIPESIRAVNNVHMFKRLLKTHFLTNVTDFLSFHSAAILTILRYIVLPSQTSWYVRWASKTLLLD